MYKFTGANYKSGLHVKEIAVILRGKLKELYPKHKFSIVSDHRHISIALMVSPVSPFANPDIGFIPNSSYNKEQYLENWKRCIEEGNMGINQYWIKDEYRITGTAQDMFQNIYHLMNSYNFDDSDSQSDYFHTNFYSDLQIGRWNKPLIIKP